MWGLSGYAAQAYREYSNTLVIYESVFVGSLTEVINADGRVAK